MNGKTAIESIAASLSLLCKIGAQDDRADSNSNQREYSDEPRGGL